MAQRLMVARSIVHRPRIALPRRAHAGPRPAVAHRAVGHHPRGPRGRSDGAAHHALHGGGRPALRTPRDHGPRPILALDTPAALKRTVGADTIVRVVAEGDRERLAATLRDLDGVTDTRVIDGTVQLTATGAEGLLPRVLARAEGGGVQRSATCRSTSRAWRRSSSPSPGRISANERRHHRTDAGDAASRRVPAQHARRGVRRAAPSRPRGPAQAHGGVRRSAR